MRSNVERIEIMHKRAEKLRRQRNKRLMVGSVSVGVTLFAALIVASVVLDARHAEPAGTTFAASSLLSESIGGYVMVAIVGFMIGVAITVLIRKHLEIKRNTKEEH